MEMTPFEKAVRAKREHAERITALRQRREELARQVDRIQKTLEEVTPHSMSIDEYNRHVMQYHTLYDELEALQIQIQNEINNYKGA